jgi:RimJ/RimL family protein N-acetyltransferase
MNEPKNPGDALSLRQLRARALGGGNRSAANRQAGVAQAGVAQAGAAQGGAAPGGAVPGGERKPGQPAGQQPQRAGQPADQPGAQKRPQQKPQKRPPDPPIRLETENYIVRSMTHDDVNEDYRDWTHDPEVMAGVNSSPTSMTIEDMHKYVDRFDNRNSFHFGIFDKHAGNKLVGFYVIYRDRRHNLAQTNVVIGNKDYWGKAIVLETRAVVLDFLFDVVKVGKIWGNPMVRNIRSVFNYKAQGFTAEGMLRRHRIDPGGNRVDQVMFGLFPEEWAKRKAELRRHGKDAGTRSDRAPATGVKGDGA